MTLKINGNPQEFETAPTLPGLLGSLGLEGKPVVVEHNRQALSPSEFEGVVLKDDDALEIIAIAAGG